MGGATISAIFKGRWAIFQGCWAIFGDFQRPFFDKMCIWSPWFKRANGHVCLFLSFAVRLSNREGKDDFY
jgi:hypothetical protein